MTNVKGYMRSLVVAVVICAILEILLGGCTKTVYVPVESVSRDTLRLVTERVDSAYIHDSVYIKDSGDTVYYYKWKTEYKLQMRTDTVYSAKVDTVQVPYTVEVVKKEIPKGVWRLVFAMGVSIVALIGYIRYKG